MSAEWATGKVSASFGQQRYFVRRVATQRQNNTCSLLASNCNLIGVFALACIVSNSAKSSAKRYLLLLLSALDFCWGEGYDGAFDLCVFLQASTTEHGLQISSWVTWNGQNVRRLQVTGTCNAKVIPTLQRIRSGHDAQALIVAHDVDHVKRQFDKLSKSCDG